MGHKRAAILGGQLSLQHPAVGAIAPKGRTPFCTGTLIAPEWVLTAAHCVDAVLQYQQQTTVQFRVDLSDGNGSFQSTFYELAATIHHPDYLQKKLTSVDIGLLKLSKQVTGVTPLGVHQAPMDASWVGRDVQVIGYGLIQVEPSAISPNKKHSASIPIYLVDPKTFVHYDVQTGKSACHGDSGGPALRIVGGQTVVVGVTSVGYKVTKTSSGQPPTLCDGGAIACRVDVHLGFLSQHVPGLSACQQGQSQPCYTGPANTAGVGECRKGSQVCQGGQWQACTGQVVPQPQEACDGKDNNCNGQTDEGCGCLEGQTRECYDGPAQQKGIGICQPGSQVCQGGQWQECTGWIAPAAAEHCANGKDDNCNGSVDEGCASQSCQEGSSEVCYTGAPGTSGVGPCRNGQRSCRAGQWGPCEGEIVPAEREICADGKDNDCDGQTDEGCASQPCEQGQRQACYTGPAASKGRGVCQSGIQVCQGGVWQPCAAQVLPAQEVCADGKDNDCDGQTDEGCATSLRPDAGLQDDTQWRIRGAGCDVFDAPGPGWSAVLGWLCFLFLLFGRSRVGRDEMDHS